MKTSNNLQIIFLSLTVSCFVLSCDSVVDLEVPIEKPKLVVKGNFDSYGNWKFNVTKSMHILDIAEPKVYDSALITVYQGENMLFTVPPDKVPGSYYYFNEPVAPGTEYQIKVEAPEMETAYASTLSPNLPNVLSIYYDSISIIIDHQGWYEEYKLVEITFKDEAKTENFYQISIEGFMLPHYYNPDMSPLDSTWEEIRFHTEDPAVKIDDQTLYDLKGMWFSDIFIDGKEHTLKLLLDRWYFERVGKLRVYFSSATKDGYLFAKTYRAQRLASHDPFSEPVNVHSNIENGYGIFYGITTDTAEFVVK